MISGHTRTTGLIGGAEQVPRSLSPAVHNAAFRASRLDWVYLCFPVADADPYQAIKGLFAAGAAGLNVTMPHKVSAMKAADRLDPAAEATGAVNTLHRSDGEVVGYNTDGPGLVRFLEHDVGVEIKGARVLVVGAGGSARAAVASLSRAGASSITVAARDAQKANSVEDASAKGVTHAVALADGLAELHDLDIIINATPVGQKGEPPLIPFGLLAPGMTVVDLVYSPPVTTLVLEARRRGATAHSGLGMLLHQAALAFEIWTGKPAPMDVMSAAAISAMNSKLHRREGPGAPPSP